MIDIFLLLLLFQVKHFAADFPLQTSYMLNKGKINNWVFPLLSHVLVHSVFTLLILLMFVSPLLSLSLAMLDLVLHFIIDRIKASPFILPVTNPSQPLFWTFLGLDQMFHHLTYILIIFITTM